MPALRLPPVWTCRMGRIWPPHCLRVVSPAARTSSLRGVFPARLASIGIAVLRLDFTGLGHRDGEFANTSFTSNVQDLIAAGHYLAGRNMAPSLMIGHSLGGAAVLRVLGPAPRSTSSIGASHCWATWTKTSALACWRLRINARCTVRWNSPLEW